MLQTVARRPKPIARFFVIIMYLQLLVPVQGVYAESRTFFHVSPYLWQTKQQSVTKPDAITPQQLSSLLKEKGSNAFSVSIENVDDSSQATTSPQSDSVTTGGPSQPEMSQFQSINANNMVDLFSGDFQYNIPLMDVGGYPVNLSYRGGVSMDQEASWVGLGWAVNPGTITRNMRGLPDDFDGKNDSVKKINSMRENKTIGVNVGGDVEVVGLPIGLGASVGIFLNNYKGWGIEQALNVSINSGNSSKGSLSGGLSITNNSQDGLTVAPSFSVKSKAHDAEDNAAITGSSLTISLPYNSRSGAKSLGISAGVHQYTEDAKNQGHSGSFSSSISFASPSYTPTISIPYTSRQFSFTAKVGGELKVVHASTSISGYVSKQGIDQEDTLLALPSYGYLHFYEGSSNDGALLDFNREKEIPYREKPAVQHIAVPGYTYDAFSITGEGTGGMFRAYRGDIGFVYDHHMKTKDLSDRLSVDVGVTDLVHAGVDLNVNRAYSQTGPWREMNLIRNALQFKNNSGMYEAVYFRNPSEKAINSKKFYDAIGGDDVVAVNLAQPAGSNTSQIYATNYLTRYRNKQAVGQLPALTAQTAKKDERDKRTQVISYLNAKEADLVGHSKYIESYTPNQFSLANCTTVDLDNIDGNGVGLVGEYYSNLDFAGTPQTRTDAVIDFNWGKGTAPISGVGTDKYSIRWTGRVKAPVTGTYTFTDVSDDGFRLWINDTLVINNWKEQSTNNNGNASGSVNLVAGELYKIKVEYFENKGYSIVKLMWSYPGQSNVTIPQSALYGAAKDSYTVGALLREKRVNRFRKENHISQISVLNNDGRNYVYGIPVYNTKQRDVTFSVNKDRGNRQTGLAGYNHGSDNSTANKNGKDWYYNSEEVPAYAHSFLLTGILSPDYVDLTGNGISDDDPGDAVKFNYSKICGIDNPYRWRLPYVKDSATYNEGLRSYNRDDKGSYTYGEKELWYLHTIESKTMVATFTVENRLDVMAIDEAGNKYNDGTAKRLKEINLYSKADFIKDPATAIPIKTVHFEYSYELCKGINKPVSDSGKLTLKRVWFTYNGNNKGKLNPYVFHYSNTNPNYNIKLYDRWGSYKDPIQNSGSTSIDLITNDECPYSLQDSAKAAVNAAAWTLDSIYLPSGGSMKIDLESDEYAYVQNKRAMQLFKILGMGASANMSSGYSNYLYTNSIENLYVYITVPDAVATKDDVYRKYLDGITKLYFRLNVRMPDDRYGSGNEYVTGYADIDNGGYGRVNNNTIWVKLGGVSLAGDGGGSYSPMAKAAIQYLRLNLPGKAYPGSEVGEDLDLAGGVKVLASMATNIINSFSSFDRIARGNNWGTMLDLKRSYIRLMDPGYRKFGGGHRVKRITIYDNWDKMANQRAAIYGQEYTYTTTREVNSVQTTISSGIAQYEPGIGNDENPFHEPIEYTEKTGILGPTTMGYTEEPLGESFFPSAGVGYSKVRVRTINYKDKKSANGYAETQFYTAYDFPVYTDRSMLDVDTKKRYKPSLANFLRINARHYLVMSQGFKVELNDMHGKMRSQATYSETNPKDYVTYSEQFYRVDDLSAESKRLSNTVPVMNPDGTIDAEGIIGKDVELMTDMREQLSVTNGYNVNLNSELFTLPFPTPPFFLIPSFLNLAQREENLFRSAATFKVIQRYGIIDSVVSIDKGSRVTARNMLYDSETGEVILSSTQNEFNDPQYQFSYPSHWAYDGMGLAYKNIDAQFDNVTVKDGRITSVFSNINDVFSGGDEILVAGKVQTGAVSNCTAPLSTFPTYTKIWAVDTSVISNGTKTIYFIDKDGKAYNGDSVSLKIIRSGRRNQLGSVGSVTSLVNPMKKNTQGNYELVLNTSSKVINTSAAEYRQYWKVAEHNKQREVPACLNVEENCRCLKLFFDYIFRAWPAALAFKPSDAVLVRTLVWTADGYYRDNYGYDNIDLCECSILNDNLSGLFYSYGNDSYDAILNAQVPYLRVRIGRCVVKITFNFSNNLIYYLNTKSCANGKIDYTLTTPSCRSFWFSYKTAGAQVTYTNCSGQVVTVTPPATDTLYTFCAQDLNSVSTSNCSNCYAFYYQENACLASDNRTVDAEVTVESCDNGSDCDSISSLLCYNPVTDSTVNPYLYGLLGNWRSNRSYVYYGSRAEEDPTTSTNIRANGTFADFVPFWQFSGGKLQPVYDTTRWVWNSESTMFNSKGLEIENKDPLGRYNAGLYGYNYTLPTAVAQNAKYREVTFEGFEDYGYNTQVCEDACPSQRHIDFSSYVDKFDTLTRHSGKRSLRLLSQEQAGVTFNVATRTTDTSYIPLTFTTEVNSCSSAGNVLKSIQATNAMMLPTFSPSIGQRMVVSAWVKEDQDCKCTSYANNKIDVLFSGYSTTSVSFTPTGSIIEGWQRYEGVFDIPGNTVSITVNMRSTGSPTVYFDDLRIHPFNANIKSFVFHPVNLRLMAEMDENNYATFYEYDDDGTLIRVKKETQRGIKTIKETRSALLKE